MQQDAPTAGRPCRLPSRLSTAARTPPRSLDRLWCWVVVWCWGRSARRQRAARRSCWTPSRASRFPQRGAVQRGSLRPARTPPMRPLKRCTSRAVRWAGGEDGERWRRHMNRTPWVVGDDGETGQAERCRGYSGRAHTHQALRRAGVEPDNTHWCANCHHVRSSHVLSTATSFSQVSPPAPTRLPALYTHTHTPSQRPGWNSLVFIALHRLGSRPLPAGFSVRLFALRVCASTHPEWVTGGLRYRGSSRSFA